MSTSLKTPILPTKLPAAPTLQTQRQPRPSDARTFWESAGIGGTIQANRDARKVATLPHKKKDARMYAIAFDLDTATLEQTYHAASYNNAYADIRKRLELHGFNWQQGSVYFGGETVNAVTCVVAVMDLTRTFPRFAASVRDIRMLRIEEQNNLRPAIDSAIDESAQ